jgi:hypothetical protein
MIMHSADRAGHQPHLSGLWSRTSQLLTTTAETPLFTSCICFLQPRLARFGLFLSSLSYFGYPLCSCILRTRTCPGDGYSCALISAAAFSRKNDREYFRRTRRGQGQPAFASILVWNYQGCLALGSKTFVRHKRQALRRFLSRLLLL